MSGVRSMQMVIQLRELVLPWHTARPTWQYIACANLYDVVLVRRSGDLVDLEIAAVQLVPVVHLFVCRTFPVANLPNGNRVKLIVWRNPRSRPTLDVGTETDATVSHKLCIARLLFCRDKGSSVATSDTEDTSYTKILNTHSECDWLINSRAPALVQV